MNRIVFVAVLVLAAMSMASAKVMYSRQMAPTGWGRVAPAEESAPLTFILALKQQNLDVLESTFWAVSTPGSPQYREFMSIEDINAMVAPEDADIMRVVKWLSMNGIEHYTLLGDAIEVTTDVKTGSKLFSTEFHVFQHRSGKKVTKHWGAYSVPEHLEDIVEMVAGISEFPILRENMRKPVAPNQGIVGVVPQTIQQVYGTPANPTANSKSSQSVIEFEGQSYSPSDLQNFATQMGLTIAPLSSAHVIGSNDPNAPGTEAELDIQFIAGVGINVENWFWLEGGEAWLYGFAVHFSNTQDVPLVNSISYGWNEEDQCENGIGGAECQQLGVDSRGYVQRVNTEFQKIGVRGVSLICASGDSGANGRTDPLCVETKLNPTFPAASPYITSVGATQVSNAQTNLPNPPPVCTSGQYSCASGGTEEAVSYAQAHFASGGGFSNIAPMPEYQKDAVQAYLNSGVELPPASYFNSTSRGYPDIAAFGSNNLIYQEGIEPVGGTSASSPIVAGVFALLNNASLQKSGKPLGFLNPLIYKAFASDPTHFNDITIGDNKCTEQGCGFGGSCKGFKCAAGWDPVTGVGSPNYPKLLDFVNNL